MTSSAAVARVDHLVYVAPDLDVGVREIAQLTGVTPASGGQHPGRGTRNALIALGPSCYLEIVAPDPGQPAPVGGRWLGVDACVATGVSRLSTWAVPGADLAVLARSARDAGVPLGEIRSGRRKQADGSLLNWQLTDPHPLLESGVVPFLIDWGDSPHPSGAAAQGARLVELRIEHPDPRRVRHALATLGVPLDVHQCSAPSLVATIDGRHGRVELR